MIHLLHQVVPVTSWPFLHLLAVDVIAQTVSSVPPLLMMTMRHNMAPLHSAVISVLLAHLLVRITVQCSSLL